MRQHRFTMAKNVAMKRGARKELAERERIAGLRREIDRLSGEVLAMGIREDEIGRST